MPVLLSKTQYSLLLLVPSHGCEQCLRIRIRNTSPEKRAARDNSTQCTTTHSLTNSTPCGKEAVTPPNRPSMRPHIHISPPLVIAPEIRFEVSIIWIMIYSNPHFVLRHQPVASPSVHSRRLRSTLKKCPCSATRRRREPATTSNNDEGAGGPPGWEQFLFTLLRRTFFLALPDPRPRGRGTRDQEARVEGGRGSWTNWINQVHQKSGL